jgi:peptidoglycan hydrolase CwlO-like protein
VRDQHTPRAHNRLSAQRALADDAHASKGNTTTVRTCNNALEEIDGRIDTIDKGIESAKQQRANTEEQVKTWTEEIALLEALKDDYLRIRGPWEFAD